MRDVAGMTRGASGAAATDASADGTNEMGGTVAADTAERASLTRQIDGAAAAGRANLTRQIDGAAAAGIVGRALPAEQIDSAAAANGGPGGANGASETGGAAPLLRGVLHAGAFPAAAVAAIVLIAGAPTRQARLAAAVYGVACAALFGVSAAYHRSPPGSRRRGLLARLDHVSILLLIGGTYTPLAVLALRGWAPLAVLAVIWTVAAVGGLVRLIWRPAWRRAPRWLSTSFFIALGWLAVLVLPQLMRGAGVLVLALILAGGILYSLGGVVYARQRPDPSPRWFGFHEVFHAMTILAYLTQYAAVSLVVYRAA